MKCTTYYFRPLGLLLLLCLIPLCSIAQNITVKGIVKDNLGESVIGANVTLIPQHYYKIFFLST